MSAETLFRWHMRPGAFERLAPPWEDIRVVDRRGQPNEAGYRIVFSVPVGPIRRRWVAEHQAVEAGRMFRDVQVEGPFKQWEHTHWFRDRPPGSLLEDEISFELPLGAIGRTFGKRMVSSSLERTFRYRHRTTKSDLEAHERYRAVPAMTVLVLDSGGEAASEVCSFLATGGHDVVRLRAPDSDVSRLEGVDGVVHLEGEATGSPVADASWRTRAVANLSTKPKILVTDSAIELERDLASAGSRVVRLRTGVILTPRKGALARSLGRWRLGFRASGGNELPLSWITADELASVVLHALATESLEGGVCASSPSPSTLRELGATLRRVAGRRIVAAASSPFPEGGPAALLASGYRFRYPDLEDALRHMLGRSGYA